MQKLTHDPNQPKIMVTSAGQQITMQLKSDGSDDEKQSAAIVMNGYHVHVEATRLTAQNAAKIARKLGGEGARKPEVSRVQDEFVLPSIKLDVFRALNAIAAEKLGALCNHQNDEKTGGVYDDALELLQLMLWSCRYEMELVTNDGLVSVESSYKAEDKLTHLVNLTW